MASVSGSQGKTELQQRLSIAYETRKLSIVLQILDIHRMEFPDLEQAKIEFAVHFLGYIKSEDPAGVIQENAKLFENAVAAEEAVKRHFARMDEAEDLRDQVADIRAAGRTFSMDQLGFVPREDDRDDETPPSPLPRRSSSSLLDRVRDGQWGKKR